MLLTDYSLTNLNNYPKRDKMATGKKRMHAWTRSWACLVSVGLLLGLLVTCPCLGGQGVTVALLPMEPSTGVLVDMGAGVRAMLTSRLAGHEGMVLVEPARVDRVLRELGRSWDRKAPAPLFTPLGAAYLLALGLKDADHGWLLRAELFDPFVTDHPIHTFQLAGEASQELVPAVDRLAGEIALFLREREKATQGAVAGAPDKDKGQRGEGRPEKPAKAANAPAAVGEFGGDLAAFRTAHPEKSDLDIQFAAGVYRIDAAVATSPVAMTMQAMDVGDVDGDGEDEMVLASAGEIVVQKMQGGSAPPLASFEVPAGVVVHALSIADLNHNGRQEIYVSALAGDMPRSFILEWGPAGLTVLAKDLGWYIRVLTVPGEGMLLAGQRFDAMVAGQLFWLRWQDTVLVADRKVLVPKDIDLFNFALADLDGDGASEAISLDAGHHLQVHDAHGALLWRSEELYGVNQRAVSGRPVEGELIPLFEPTRQRLPVPCRIVVTDFNGDGKNDIVVNENRDPLAGVLAGDHISAGGSIFGLTWDGRRLRQVWDTAPLAGRILDYQVRPVAAGNPPPGGPGRHAPAKLYVAALSGQGVLGLPSAQSGQLLVFEMDLGWL